MSGSGPISRPLRVGLFATCLLDLFRPSVGFAALRLLEEAGCEVVVPPAQTCCGQPAYNSGNVVAARSVARQLLDAFEPCDYVVVPSGSCAGMLHRHVPDLFAGDPDLHTRASHLATRSHELVSFLFDICGMRSVEAQCHSRVTYHDSCSGLRELGIRQQPRRLLESVEGLELTEMSEPEVCCGFGGTFCVKYPEISDAMVAKKVEDAVHSGADMVLAGDLGCLFNMAGKASRDGRSIEFRHVAEVLAGFTDVPAIGRGKR